jgi:NAD(P)-dependent dehydrogenase (short-subunit alcohol dehydrogenase family)
MMRGKQEVVVITGASAGLGRAIAREFGRRKAKVGLIARGVDGLNAAKREIEEMGGEALVLPLDVSDVDAVFQAAGQVERALGPIDVWVNNAMVSVFSPVKEMTPAEYKRVTEVTYLGYVYGTLAALNLMRERNRGTIIQVGSALAYRAIPLQSAYCAAKHAVKGFTESLRTELLHDKSKIQVCLVEMPALNTPQFRWVLSRLPGLPQPVPPIFQPEVGARAVVWMADHPRKEINLGYPTLKAVWGEKLAPRYADWVLSREGYSGQQLPVPDPHNRPNNLWAPVPGDHGAHGVFDSRAKEHSWEFWLFRNRWPVLAASLLGLFGVMALRQRGIEAMASLT